MKNKNQNFIYYLFLLSFFLLTNSACKKDDPVTILKVGDAYQGGKIAYLLKSGDPGYDSNTQHGIIAAETDQATAIAWDTGNSVETGASATAIGSGDENTVAITFTVGAGTYAAKACALYSPENYYDWFLPSIDELDKLYLNRAAIGGFLGSYWSSTETTLDNAMLINFGTGAKSEVAKFGTFNVRAIRYF